MSTTPPSSSPRPSDRPVVAHDAKALGDVPPNLVFDTEVAAYLLDPARRGYPLDELCEERGLAVNADDEQARPRRARPHARRAPGAADQRARARRPAGPRSSCPLVHVLRECEKQGIKLDTARLEQSATRIRADAAQLEREIWESRARSS